MLITLLAMQAAPLTIERVTPAEASLASFDLAKAKGHAEAKGCDIADTGDDIVVCAYRKAMDFDTKAMPDFAEKPIRAGVDLPGGARAAVTVQQVDIGGTPSRRVMVGLKLPF